MIVLHAAFSDRRLLLWAEPDAGKAGLVAAAAQLGAQRKFTQRDLHEAVAWLPTREGCIAPSGLLAGDAPIPDEECYLAARGSDAAARRPAGDRSPHGMRREADRRARRADWRRPGVLDRGHAFQRRAGPARPVPAGPDS